MDARFPLEKRMIFRVIIDGIEWFRVGPLLCPTLDKAREFARELS